MSDPKHLLIEAKHEDGGDHGEGNWLISYADLMTLLVGFFVILLSFSSVDQEEFEKAKESISKQFGGLYEKPFGDLADRLKEELKKIGIGDQVAIKTNENGVEVSFLGAAFFNTGSVNFKPGVLELLSSITPLIKNEAHDFKITIEGHTDDVPVIAGEVYQNNWELSSIRACRVLEFFLNAGFSPLKMTAVGFGESRPSVPNRDSNGKAIPENQSQNRRVVIKLFKEGSQSL